jgi:hypothetical protein
MDDLKLPGRNVKAVGKDINMNSWLEKWVGICFKKGRVQSKIYIGSKFEDDKEQDLREKY